MIKYFSKFAVILFILVLATASCKNEEPESDDSIIAVIGNKKLLKEDVYNFIPDKLSYSDSLKLSEKYIDKWIKDRLVYKYAKTNLKDSSEIDRKVKQYRRKLYIHEFEEQYLKENLDSVITNNEIRNYYNNNLEKYVLKYPAVKAHYLKIKSENLNYYRAYNALRRSGPENMDEVYAIEKRTGKDLVEYQNWIYLDKLLDDINAEYNSDIRAKIKRGYFTGKDSVHRYLVKINDFRMPGDTMPVNLIEDKIANILINKKKKELLLNLKNKLLRDAKKDKNIVINEN